MIRRHRRSPLLRTWSAAILVACGGLGLPASMAEAQVAGSPTSTGVSSGRVEVWGGLVLPFSGTTGTLDSTYSPPFSGTTHRSEASQVLTFDGARGLGLEIGAAVYPGRSVGVEGRFEVSRASLAGTSSVHHVLLDYTALYPPSYQPVRNVLEYSTSWPDPEGTLRRVTIDLGLAGRFRLGRSVGGRLSGGLSLIRVSGPLESLAFTTFWLGGHSVLFSETYEVAARFEPTWTAGVNLGGGVDIGVARRAALVADARLIAAASAKLPVAVVDVANRDEVVMAPDMGQIRSTMRPGPVEIGLTRARVLVGLKVAL